MPDPSIELHGKYAACLLVQSDAFKRLMQRYHAQIDNFTPGESSDGLISTFRQLLGSWRRKKHLSLNTQPRVVIVERQLLHYRVPFYQYLRALMKSEGIELQLLVGEGTSDEKMKMDERSLDWAIRIPTRYFLRNRVCWQPFGVYARDADMVIVMHENKLIYNFWLMSFGRPRRLAFWGHGRNMQSARPDGLKERVKRWTVTKVDWWFAYTESSAILINNAGFPCTHTTIVENAIDTNEMSALCKSVSADDCQQLRVRLNLGNGPVGLYLGSLYQEKRLAFLLDAARKIRDVIPEFQLLVAGAGPEQSMIETAAMKYAWVHYIGPLQGRNKAEILMLADIMLNPGLVGLGILDSFVSGTPMFTTNCGLHSPEISYMVSGRNGVMTDNSVDAFANAVITALSDPALLTQLEKEALSTAPRYTIENMARRICNGIMTCLSTV